MSVTKKKKSGQPSPKRLEFVELQLGGGARWMDVVPATVEKFGCSHRTAERDVGRVYAKWAEDEPDMRAARRERMCGELDDLYQRALDKNDLASAIKVQDRRAKLWGIDAPIESKVDLTARVGLDGAAAAQVKEMLPAERLKRIAELEAKKKAAELEAKKKAKPRKKAVASAKEKK